MTWVEPALKAMPKSVHLHGSITRDQNVLGFDVAMDEAVTVGKVQGGGNLGRDMTGTVDVKRRLLLDGSLQAEAVDQLHDHVVQVTVLADIIDRDDIGVSREAGGELRFSLEALYDLRIDGEMGVKDFDSDLTS